MAVSLQVALERLRSEKVKERQEGLELIDQIFSDPENVANLDPKGDGKAWLKTFQSLFACVLVEKSACLKKGSIRNAQTVAINRLRDSAYTVRQLVERSVVYLNRRVVKALVSHLTQILNHQGTLFQPISTSYVKTLATLLQFSAHVDNLDLEEWVSIATLCFHSVLGHSLDDELKQADTLFNQMLAVLSSDQSTDATRLSRNLSLEDVDYMGCLSSLLSSPTAPIVNQDHFGRRLLCMYATFFDRYPVESSSHLPAVSGLAHLLRELELNATSHVLFFALSCWRPLSFLWSTKNKLLKEQLVICFHIIVPVVSSCLHPSFDPSAYLSLPLAKIRTETRALLIHLHQVILAEQTSKWGLDCLAIGSIRFCSPSQAASLSDQPFSTSTFFAASTLTEAQSVSWIALDIYARLVDGLFQGRHLQPDNTAVTEDLMIPDSTYQDHHGSPLTSRSPRKRTATQAEPYNTKRSRRETNVLTIVSGQPLIQELIHDLQDQVLAKSSSLLNQNERIWKLQLLTFIIDRSSSELDQGPFSTLADTLISLASDHNSTVQSWALVAICLLTFKLTTFDASSDRLEKMSAKLGHVWTLCLRRLASPSVSRIAAHFLSFIVDHRILSEEKMTPDLRRVLIEVEIQGPVHLHDSVCHFIVSALGALSNEASSSNIRDRVCTWLVSVVQSTCSFTLTASDPFDHSTGSLMDLLDLFCTVCGSCSPFKLRRANSIWRRTDAVIHLEAQYDTESIRRFLLSSELQGLKTAVAGIRTSGLQNATEISYTTAQKSISSAEARRLISSLERQISVLLSSLNQPADLVRETTGAENLAKGQDQTWSKEHIALSFNFSLLSLAFNSFVKDFDILPTTTLSSLCCRLLIQLLKTIMAREDWSYTDKCQLLVELTIFFPSQLEQRQGRSDSLIVNVGSKSSVRQTASLNPGYQRKNIDVSFQREASQLLVCFWQTVKQEGVLQEIRSLLLEFLTTVNSQLDGVGLASLTSSSNQTIDNDDNFFGGASVHSQNASILATTDASQDCALKTLIEYSVVLVVKIPHLLADQRVPVHEEFLVNLLFDGSLQALLYVGHAVLRAVKGSYLWLSQRDLADILDRIGSDLLTSYEYARDQEARILAIQSVTFTMSCWIKGQKLNPDLADRLRKLSIFFVEQVTKPKWRSPWKVRRHCAVFLETFLQQDPNQSLWYEDDEAISRCLPSDAVLFLNSDLDTRVRVKGATASTVLFQQSQQDDEAVLATYDKLKDYLPVDHFRPENIATRILCLGNVAIVESSLRRNALFHLLEIYLATQSMEASLSEVFVAVSEKLGFSSTKDLYQVFAGQITWGMMMNSYDPLQLPFRVLGFRSRKESLEQSFRESGSMMLAMQNEQGRSFFESLIRLTKRTVPQGIVECLPFLVASQMGFLVEDHLPGGTIPHSTVWEKSVDSLASWDPVTGSAGIKELIKTALDDIVVMMLTMYYEPQQSAANDESFLETLSRQDSGCYQQLLQLSEPTVASSLKEFRAHEPNRPFFSPLILYESFKVLAQSGDDPFGEDVAYHVLRQIFYNIDKAHFINDQRRFLQATQLYVSMCGETIKKSDLLLGLLLHGATALAEQQHLHSLLVPLVHCAFKSCKTLAAPPETLASSILAWANVSLKCRHIVPSVGKSEKKALTVNEWVSEAILDLAGSPKTFGVALNALMLWPGSIPEELRSLVTEKMDLTSLKRALQHSKKATITAPVLGRIRQALKATQKHEHRESFSDTIWLVIESLKRQKMEEQDLSDLADLAEGLAQIFATCGGRLDPPSISNPSSSDSHSRISALTLATKIKDPWRSIQAVIVLFVLEDCLRGPNLEWSRAAFFSLRGILYESQNLIASLAHWPPMAIAELSILAKFGNLVRSAAPKLRIEDLQTVPILNTSIVFQDWVCSIVPILCHALTAIESSNFFPHMLALVEGRAEIAAMLLPLLLQLFTAKDVSGPDDEAAYLEGCRIMVSEHFTTLLQNNQTDPQCWAAIIRGYLHVRQWRAIEEDPLLSDHWFEIDKLLLARRCLDCKMYTAALLFIELDQDHPEDQPGSKPNDEHVSDLLYEAYSNVDDPDGFYGIMQADVRKLLVRRLHHEGDWHRALEYHAADFEAIDLIPSHDTASIQCVGRAFHMLGFNRLAFTLSSREESGLPAQPLANDKSNYEMAWRTGTWDIPTRGEYLAGTTRGVFQALRALNRGRGDQVIDQSISQALGCELVGLKNASCEAIAEVRKVQKDLHSLQQIKEWRAMASKLGSDEAISHFRAFWADAELPFDFAACEQLLSVRQAILQAERSKLQTNQIGDLLLPASEEAIKLERAILISISQHARKHGKLQISVSATTKAQALQTALDDSAKLAQEELASVLWAQSEHPFAIRLLEQLVSAFELSETAPTKQRARKALLLARLGEWRATTRSQHPREIDTKCFKPALELTITSQGSKQNAHEQAKVAYKWAKFADDQYRSANADERARLRMYIERRKEEIRQNQLESEKTSSKTHKSRLLQYQRQAEKILRQDENQLREIESSRTLFLQRAVVMYARALVVSDRHDDAMVRLTSLWFDNAADEDLNALLSASLASIASHKFLSLTHQLSARLSSNRSGHRGSAKFQSNLTALLLRMCKDHPFHTLYAIFALKKAGSDAKPSRFSRTRSSLTADSLDSSQALRSSAAESIWNQVKAEGKRRIQEFEEVCEAYVSWAELDLTSYGPLYFNANGTIKRGPLGMPPSTGLKLSRLRDCNVPVATVDLPIDLTCKYESFVSIARYSDQFTTAGGIHLPKISECIGSDGRRYKQLFKRDDDLRQDAVMQQVFRMVNDLLRTDRRANDRKLKVRTYAVVPLGPQCGLLEFVGNTVPLGEILVKMHTRYRDNDITPTAARCRLREAQGLAAAEKLNVFLDVCEEIKPAFRFFFTETQKHPPNWFITRLNYTRSVATSSIVGHILGLGDRHVSNILLDKETGELVHIDFGVAFDQGKLLPIPELVPFRLTRDLVDGMGSFGIEGTFRRCCEETLRVLRHGQDVIKTVLEVFKHDPLFAWTSNPIKVLKAQGGDETAMEGYPKMTTNEDAARAPNVDSSPGPVAAAASSDTAELSADRAISSVLRKLSCSLSVEYTVNDLIQQAMDARNLSAIFHGWQATL